MKLSHFINGKLDKKYLNIKCESEKSLKKYKFFLDNITNYIYITDRLVFIRESEDYYFELNISEKPTCKLLLKKENKEFIISVDNASYYENDKYTDIKYKLETDTDEHHIILEIGD